MGDLGSGIGDLVGNVGNAVSNAMEGVVDAIGSAVRSVSAILQDLLPLPVLLVGGGLILLVVFWVLIKR
jgi:hypothetical protein